jgi:hypothetical protein
VLHRNKRRVAIAPIHTTTDSVRKFHRRGFAEIAWRSLEEARHAKWLAIALISPKLKRPSKRTFGAGAS